MELDLHSLTEKLEGVEALDAVGDSLAGAVDSLLPQGVVKDFLAGRWLGHALHPVLTDVPIGAWVSASTLDIVGGRSGRKSADRLIALGLLASLPTAAAGLADWKDTMGGARRVGLLHAAGNTTAIGLYAASLAARRRGKRMSGIGLALMGMSVAGASAYLGGHLSFSLGVGVDQTAFEHRPADWTAVIDETDLPDGQARTAEVNGATILLARRGALICALSDRCTHRGGPLHEGEVTADTVTCPWHGSRFALKDGRVLAGPASAPQPGYDVRVSGGKIEVKTRHVPSG